MRVLANLAWGVSWLTVVLMSCGVASPIGVDTRQQGEKPQHDPLAASNTFHYRMAGRVRLLLFWVSKENVGGGQITFSDRMLPAENLKAEGIEVLFGSNPGQVPGGVNRWGYGQEWAYWRLSPNASAAELQYTVFTGFMRHSGEEALSQVYASREHEQSAQLFWYDGIESTVRPEESVSEIRHFSEPQEIDYQQYAMVESAYRQRRDAGPPDKTEAFKNETRIYSAPYGFLTGLREVTRQIARQFQGNPAEFLKGRYSASYAYNAKTYVLEVTRLKHLPSFFLADVKPDGKERTNSSRQVSDVAEADFRLKNQTDGSKHDFSLWFPLRGDLQGVPLRILDKPRWWLQVELRLDHQ